jgi:hypothetical protein
MATEKIHHSDDSTKHKSRATQIDNALKDQENPTEKWKPFLIGGVIVVIVLCIVGLSIYFKSDSNDSTEKESSATTEKTTDKIVWSEQKFISVSKPETIKLERGYLYKCWTESENGQIKFVSTKTGEVFILKSTKWYNSKGKKINPPLELLEFKIYCPVGQPQTLVYRKAVRPDNYGKTL